HLARDEQAALAVDVGPLHRAPLPTRRDVPGERVGRLVVVVVRVEGPEADIGVSDRRHHLRIRSMAMVLERFRLDGKVAIVTGAGRGIGAASALALAEAGADVLLAAR